MRLERAVAERQAAAERGDSGDFVIWLTRERFYRRLAETFEPRLHPRDRRGEFRDTPNVDIGVTPYRGAGKAHGEDYYGTSRYKGFESYAQNHARELGVDLVGVDHTAGIWEGQTEPSASVRVRGAEDTVRRYAADLAEHFQQDGAVTFQRDKSGPHLMFRTSGQVDPDTARKAMQKHGVQGGRVRNGKIEVIDFNPTGPDGLRDKMRALAQELGLTVQYDRGSATLLAKGADYA